MTDDSMARACALTCASKLFATTLDAAIDSEDDRLAAARAMIGVAREFAAWLKYGDAPVTP